MKPKPMKGMPLSSMSCHSCVREGSASAAAARPPPRTFVRFCSQSLSSWLDTLPSRSTSMSSLTSVPMEMLISRSITCVRCRCDRYSL